MRDILVGPCLLAYPPLLSCFAAYPDSAKSYVTCVVASSNRSNPFVGFRAAHNIARSIVENAYVSCSRQHIIFALADCTDAIILPELGGLLPLCRPGL